MDYSSMTLSELRELAKERNLKGITALKKAELVERLAETEEKAVKETASPKKERAAKKTTSNKAEKATALSFSPKEEQAEEQSASEKEDKKTVSLSENEKKESDKREHKVQNKHKSGNLKHKNEQGSLNEAGEYNTDQMRQSMDEQKEKLENSKEKSENPGGTQVSTFGKESDKSETNRQEAEVQAPGRAEAVKTVQERPGYSDKDSTKPQLRNRDKNGRNIQRFEPRNTSKSEYYQQRQGKQEKPDRQDKSYRNDNRQPDLMKYDARPPRTERTVEQKDGHSELRSVSLEVQEAPGFEPEKTEEKKNVNIRSEAFTLDEFMQLENPEVQAMDSKVSVTGILEIMEGYGFIRSANYLPGENDVYVSPAQIRRFNLKTGDILKGNTRVKTQTEKFKALLYMESVNGFHPLEASKRRPFEELTPIFPDEKIKLEQAGAGIPMRITDIIAPIGKGQRGMIVSPPKAGKTTLLKQIAKTISRNYEDMHLLVLLIDERPEEVTDIRESIEGPNVEVIYSTFDELPEHHKRVSEMVLERAKRLVEHKKDVVILLDSITRLARAYNLIVPPSGRTLTGGLDPAALHMPKKFFGAARNIREGGSLTILATALVETGSKMDDVVFEEFKGTGNMELVLDRKLSEKRIFPAIDIAKSSTRRDDLLLSKEEQDVMYLVRREFSSAKGDEAIEEVLRLFSKTKNNEEFVQLVQKSLGRR